MRHRVAESLQFFVGGFQLERTLCNSVFEFVIQFTDLLLNELALSNVGADRDVLPRLSVGSYERDDGGIYPIKRTILGAILDLVVPNLSIGDGAIHLLEKFFWVVARIEDAVIPADEFVLGILT